MSGVQYKQFGLTGILLCLAMSTATADGDHAPIGDDVWNLPLFDAHVHYKEPAWNRYPVSSVVELMDKNGVAMALVSSTPDEGDHHALGLRA